MRKIIPWLIFSLIGFITQCDKSSTDSNSDKSLKPITVIQLTVQEPSGLTFNSATSHLFTVRDGAAGEIYEITTDGTLLKTIATDSKDLEGIAINPSNDTLLVVEEQNRAIVKYSLDGKLIEKILLPIQGTGSNGLEGIAIHPQTNHIFIVNEKKPALLLELTPDGKIMAPHPIDFADDLSGICFIPDANTLLLVSHESRSLYEIDLSGSMLRSWKIPVEKAEGVAVDNGGLVYVVGEQTGQLFIFDLK